MWNLNWRCWNEGYYTCRRWMFILDWISVVNSRRQNLLISWILDSHRSQIHHWCVVIFHCWSKQKVFNGLFYSTVFSSYVVYKFFNLLVRLSEVWNKVSSPLWASWQGFVFRWCWPADRKHTLARCWLQMDTWWHALPPDTLGNC